MTKKEWYAIPYYARRNMFNLNQKVKLIQNGEPTKKIFTISEITTLYHKAKIRELDTYVNLDDLEPASLQSNSLLDDYPDIAKAIVKSFDLPQQAAVEEFLKAYTRYQKVSVTPWTDGEKRLAQDFNKKFLFQLFEQTIPRNRWVAFPRVFCYDNPTSPLYGLTKVVTADGKETFARPHEDAFDKDIGLCVCLAKATGNPIPDFIRDKNKGE